MLPWLPVAAIGCEKRFNEQSRGELRGDRPPPALDRRTVKAKVNPELLEKLGAR
jgi:hypothetical protein